MEKIAEYITNNIMPFLIGVVGLLVPGLLTIFIFNRALFVELDVTKMALLAISISTPSFCFWMAIGCSLGERGERSVYTEWGPAFVCNLITFSIMLFLKIIFPKMTSVFFIIGIALFCVLIGSPVIITNLRKRNKQDK